MNNLTVVLIIELDYQLAELERQILEEEGYRAIATLCGPSSTQEVEKVNPDVIVLDLGPHAKSCGWQLLRTLRSNPNTQGIPLLVISDTEQLLEQAKQSFNVRQEIFKPYEIADFVQGVQATLTGTPLLPHPSPPPTTNKTAVEAAQVISWEAGKIMADWLKQVQQEKLSGSSSNVLPRILMNDISVWMIRIVSILRYGEGYLGTTEIRQKLAGHILEAQQHGVTLAQIIKQFEILRNLVWEALAQSSLANLTTQDVFQLGRTINTAFEEVMVQVAEQYAASDNQRLSEKKCEGVREVRPSSESHHSQR
jgi:CheY-like chemotaxis protein